MRVGPSRFTSTAESSGESNETAAAEWITMSHVASTARCSADNPSPSVLTSPLIVVMRRSVISANALAPPNCSFKPVEGVVLQDLPPHALGRWRALAVPHEQDELAIGDAPEQAFDERRAHEPGRPGDGDPLAGERFGDHFGHVYQFTSDDQLLAH